MKNLSFARGQLSAITHALGIFSISNDADYLIVALS